MNLFLSVLETNALITAFVVVALVLWISNSLAKTLFAGKINGSAIAIILGLLMAYLGGSTTGGSKGLADISVFSGLGILGGAMFRDFAIVATAYGAELEALKKAGWIGSLSVLIGVVLSFFVGAIVAVGFGVSDPISITTIGAGTATFIVGPVTGTALGAESSIIALSIAAGLVKSILVMVGTPLVARRIGLNNPNSAMIYGGLMGTNSGVAAGLAATNPKLVPYGAMTATFYTGVGCLIVPSVLFFIVTSVF